MKYTKYALLFAVSVAWCLLFAGAIMSSPERAKAAEMKGVHFADQVDIGAGGAKKTLVLNGLGLRLATFLKVKVYIGALYLEAKSSDPAKILESSTVKRVELAFVRGVGVNKLRDAWPEDLKANCQSGCDKFKGQLTQFQSFMTDMNDGDRMAFDIYPERIDIWVKGKLVGTVSGANGFSAQLLKDWIGHAPNDELKDGMLGLRSS